MGHRPPWIVCTGRVLSGTPLALALFASPLHAKAWVKWAPAPLASDSAYVALAARPPDSLSTPEYAWVEVQREWRSQRLGEQDGPTHGITASGLEHMSRPSDGRFAKLASQPYAALSESERAWLVTENAAQRAARSGPGATGLMAFVALVLALGAVGALWGIGSALNHIGH